MERSTVALPLPVGPFGRGGDASLQWNRPLMQQRRQMSGRCAVTASVVASVIFTFMRTVRLLFAPRIA